MIHQPTSRRGFTLIELLVVSAIVAVLAAILFPVFAQARDSARQATCLSNEKQLGLGLQVYAQDYDENLPSWLYGNGAGLLYNDPRFALWGWSTWVVALLPYVKNNGVFTCPNGPHTGTSWPNQALVGPKGAQMVVNLAMNQYLNDRNYGFSSIAALNAAKNPPAEVSAIAESNFNGISQDWTDGFNIPGRP